MTDIMDLADTIGRKRIADTLGVLPTAVSNHVVRGKFPPAWFDAIETLCREDGMPCPREIFAFRHASQEATE